MKVMTKQEKTDKLLLFELWSAKSLLLCCCSRSFQYKEWQSRITETVTGKHLLATGSWL